jgi:cell pole-organizing protein PopZ
MNDADDAARVPGQEPSMEDILSSIRRILSEDGESAGGDDDARMDDLANSAVMNARRENTAQAEVDAPRRETAAASGRGARGREDYALAEREEEAGLAPSNVFHLTPEMRLPPERQVLSQSTSAASSDVLSQLAKAILDRRDIGVGGRDMTIEGLVREMLRPLLKEWLDRNLPYLIERLVKKEIDLMVNRAERLED